MTTLMNFHNKIVDLDFFNSKLLQYGGKTTIKSNTPKITMRHFIFKLIKSFRKDFMKKKRGGMADLYNDTDISYSTNISNLDFASYTFPPSSLYERDIY